MVSGLKKRIGTVGLKQMVGEHRVKLIPVSQCLPDLGLFIPLPNVRSYCGHQADLLAVIGLKGIAKPAVDIERINLHQHVAPRG